MKYLRNKLPLLAIMAGIGLFTAFASVNTYEVIAQRDVPYSQVIRNVQLTADAGQNDKFLLSLHGSYQPGSFGTPKKIKLPESSKHVDLTPAHHDGSWKAGKGIGHTFVAAEPRMKVFGEAVIYLRVNTATTRHLGDVLNGDVVNIVTTEGWQLGYKVVSTAEDVHQLEADSKPDASRIVVIMIDEATGTSTAFAAELTKVGSRI